MNIFQNTATVLKMAWQRDKIVLYVIAAQILLGVAIPIVGIFMPAVVVEQILEQVPVRSLVHTILFFAGLSTLLWTANTYLDSVCFTRRMGLRLLINRDLMNKSILTDFSNLDEQEYINLKIKAQDQVNYNEKSTEQIYYCFARLGTNLLGFAVYIALLAAVNPLVMVITAVTALFGAVARHYANKWEYNHDDEAAAFNGRMWHLNNLGAQFDAAKDIRMFGMLAWFKDVYYAMIKLGYHFTLRVQRRHFAADAVNAFATFAREGFTYVYLIWLVINGGLTVDGFVLMFAAVGGFSGWVSGILVEFSTLSMHCLNHSRVWEFLAYPDTFKREDGEPIPSETKTCSLELKNVSLQYKGTDENVLENINLHIKPGEKLAVVGVNGAGKTTLVKLLCGFYDPTEGEVLFNGKNIREFDRRSYYEQFTAVFQMFNILPLSIAENVAQEFEFDEAKVMRCLEQADLVKKVSELPNGIHSLLIKDVNPNAVELSGGETQRLMLARALYKDSPVLVLDEPTAALDPIAESKLYERYNELSCGRTSVYISHRLASTRFCDRIILLDEKRIAECGTHDELMRLNGKYAELFEIQSKYYKEGADFNEA